MDTEGEVQFRKELLTNNRTIYDSVQKFPHTSFTSQNDCSHQKVQNITDLDSQPLKSPHFLFSFFFFSFPFLSSFFFPPLILQEIETTIMKDRILSYCSHVRDGCNRMCLIWI